MNAKQLRRELRRIARQEVPNGEPDLWPAIRRQIAPKRTPYSSPGTHGASIRSQSSTGSTDLSSVYVWSTDARRGRFGTGARALAACAALVLLAAVLAVVMENHGIGDNRPVGAIASPTSTAAGSDLTDTSIPATCPVTLPRQSLFVPPSSHPLSAPGTSDFWYGTNDLWTVLPATGNWSGLPMNANQELSQKVFWMSTNYEGEAVPEIRVTGERLDGIAPPLDVSQPTNGSSGDMGAFMLVGLDFPTPGCWQIIGAYKSHSLSFVVWVSIHPATMLAPSLPPLSWPSTGKLDVPITPAPGSNISGSVNALILPTGDLRISDILDNPADIVTWHVVPESCAALANTHEQNLDGQDVIPAFPQTGGTIEFISGEKTHQPLTMVAFAQRGGLPVACAPVPAVPKSLAVAYDPAPGVPRTCPVTLPSRPLFAPTGNPIDPSQPIYGDYWYGTNDLYTGLPLDGVWSSAMKVFWRSSGYSANAEPLPALTVTGKRLDGDAPAATVDGATNADGTMLVGVTFPSPGCWQISGTYRDHTLSFVVWVTDKAGNQVTQAPGPVPVVSGMPGADGLTHTDLACHASSFGPSTATPADINTEIGGIATSGQFWALLFQQMPIYANQNVQIAWKIGSASPLTLTVADAGGNRIDPSSGPTASTSFNWPRPGSEWLTSIVFPYSGCWHVQARAGTVTGDMWFEVFSVPVQAVPPATTTVAANPVAALPAFCPQVSEIQPNADFGDGYGPAHMGPLWLSAFGSARTGKAVITGFAPGYPTKVVIHPDPGLQGVVEVRGSDCATGQPLHFCYGNRTCGFNGQPATEAEFSQRGDAVVSVQGHLDLTGYILFPKVGIYRLWVEQSGQEIGSVVVQVESP